ncbi:MAG: M23 family metallopeptidase [Chloroflexota bacterium]
MPKFLLWGFFVLIGILVVVIGSWYLLGAGTPPAPRQISRLRTWFNDAASHPTWSLTAGTRCGDAPMLIPTHGYLGFGWDDSFRPGHRHSGLDIFGPDPENNVTPIVAAYDGYLTREGGWKSTVIIRHPNFPLGEVNPTLNTQQIWTYYTHMASADGAVSYIDEAFPPGTFEVFVEEGTLLGRQGNWSGSPGRPTGRHLHFSVVKSKIDGGYYDEREIDNTFEPTQFLGLTQDNSGIWRCQ